MSIYTSVMKGFAINPYTKTLNTKQGNSNYSNSGSSGERIYDDSMAAIERFENRNNPEHEFKYYYTDNSANRFRNSTTWKKDNLRLHTEERGTLDRIFGMLGYGGIVEGLYNLTDDDENTTFGQGLIEGFKYMNPFEDDVTQRNTFSDVLKNIGWEDNEDGKPNIGIGIAGFVGDVLLDPLTFLNPYASAGKVLKGTGVTLKDIDKVRKAVKAAEVSGKIQDGVDIGSKINKLTDITLDDARKIVRESNPQYSPERVESEAIKVFDGYASKVKGFRDSGHGEGFSFGLINAVPFADKIKIGDKTLASFSKQFVSSYKLRSFGDKTIAPYYNSLVNKIKTSKLGTVFSNNNKLARMEKVEGVMSAFNHYYLDYFNSGVAKSADNLKDINNSEIIREYFDNNPDYTHDDFINDVENGVYDDFLKIKEIKIKAAEEYANKVELSSSQKEAAKAKSKSMREEVDNLRTFIDESYEYSLDKVSREKYTNADMLIQRKQNQLDAAKFGKLSDDVVPTVDHIDIDFNKINEYSDDEIFSIYQNKLKSASEVENILKKYSTDINRMYGVSPGQLNSVNKRNVFHTFSLLDNFYNGNIDWSDVMFQYYKYVKNSTDFELFDLKRLAADKIGDYSYFKNQFLSLSSKERRDTIRVIRDNKISELQDLISSNKKNLSDLKRDGDYFKAVAVTRLSKSLDNLKSFKVKSDAAKVDFAYAQEETMYDILRIEDEISKMNKIAGRETIEDISVYTDRKIAENLLKTNDAIDKAEMIGEDAEKTAIFNLFSDRMKQAAEEELKIVYGTSFKKQEVKEKFLNNLNKYVEHVLTDEAKEYVTEPIIRETGKFNPSEFGSKRKFDNSRTFKTIEDGERWFSKVLAREYHKSLIDSGMTSKEAAIYFKENYDWDKASKLYIHNIADIYLERALGSNELLYSTNVNNFVKNSLCSKYNGVIEKDRVVGSYKDINVNMQAYFNSLSDDERAVYGSFKDMRDKALEEAGISKLMFADNLSFLDLTEKQAEILSKYCPKKRPVQLYNMDNYVFNKMNIYTKEQLESIQSGFTKLFDALQLRWKLLNTVVTPGFHIQNAVSNAFQSFLGVGSDAFNPKKIKLAYNIVKTKDPKQSVILNGTKYTYRELAKAIDAYKVADNTFFNHELSTGQYKFPLFRAGTFVGSNIENIQRVNIFLSFVDQGKSFEEAAEGVNKFLFDYGDLTDVEKNIFKRVIPFYTFMRKNIPLMLEKMFIEQPNTFNTLNKAITNIEKMNDDYIDENYRNPYRQDYIQLPFSIGENEYGDVQYGISNQLPYTQLDRVFDLQKLAGQTSPFIKAPIELATGTNIYTGMSTGNIVEYLAQQFPFSKIPLNSFKSKEKGTERNLYILGQLAGFPINQIKPMTYYEDYGDYWEDMFK